MTIVAPSIDPLAWAQPICSGRRWVGDCRVMGCDADYPWEEKKGKGTEGATTSPQGKANGKPKIKFIFWRGWRDGEYWDGFAEWASYRKIFEAPTSGEQVAIVIEHPQFALAKIRGVVVTKIGDLEITPDGRGECTCEFLEYRKAKKVPTGAPKGASKGVPGAGTGGGSVTEGRPKTAVELEADRLAAENEKLLEELRS